MRGGRLHLNQRRSREQQNRQKMDSTANLPPDCISTILSFTSPKDASRASLVSSVFRAAADSDAVWESFLPPDLEDIISQSSSPPSHSLPKKQLYFHLCDHPVLVANNTMSFALEKESGKKCYVIGAEGLSVIWGDWLVPSWGLISRSDFRFPRVLGMSWWHEVKGSIEMRLLSPYTRYAVFLVFKFGTLREVFSEITLELSVNYEGNQNVSIKRVLLDTSNESDEGIKQREDGWVEIEMGEFFNEFGDDGFVVCRLQDLDPYRVKTEFIVEGIEFRPKGNV